MPPDRKTGIQISIALVVLTIVAFGQVYNFDFTNYDDPDYILKSPLVRGGLTLRGIRAAFTAVSVGNWHPVTALSLMTDWQLFGPNPGAFHLVNLVWHIAATVLLFLALWQMTSQPWRSALVAALFAVHPLHVESVAWVAERKDVLSAFCWMLVLYTYGRYARHPSLTRYLIVIACFVLGLMAKPMLVTLPCVLLLLDYWPLRRTATGFAEDQQTIIVPVEGGTPLAQTADCAVSSARVPVSIRRLWCEKIPLFVISLAACGITLWAQRSAIATASQYPLRFRLANAVTTYVVYLGKTVWPIGLSCFYRYEDNQVALPWLAVEIAFLVAVSVWVVRARRSPWLLVGWLWYLGTLVPTIGLVQVGAQSLADRYTYLPLIGIFLMLAWSIPEMEATSSRRVLTIAVVATALAGLLCVTWKQVGYWRTSHALWDHALELDPQNWVAHVNLAEALEREDRDDEARKHNLAALRVMPPCVEAHINLAKLAEKRGDSSAHLQHCREAVRLDPVNVHAQNNLGLAWAKLENLSQAVECFQTVIRLAPEHSEGYGNLGLALANSGQFELAVVQFRKAIDIAPHEAEFHNNLGSALADLGQYPAALREFREALRLNPRFERAKENLDRLLELHPPP